MNRRIGDSHRDKKIIYSLRWKSVEHSSNNPPKERFSLFHTHSLTSIPNHVRSNRAQAAHRHQQKHGRWCNISTIRAIEYTRLLTNKRLQRSRDALSNHMWTIGCCFLTYQMVKRTYNQIDITITHSSAGFLMKFLATCTYFQHVTNNVYNKQWHTIKLNRIKCTKKSILLI